MEDKFQDILSNVTEIGALPFGALWRIRWTSCGASGLTYRDIAASSLRIAVSRLRKAQSTISCEREPEGGGMPPAKFRAT